MKEKGQDYEGRKQGSLFKKVGPDDGVRYNRSRF